MCCGSTGCFSTFSSSHVWLYIQPSAKQKMASLRKCKQTNSLRDLNGFTAVKIQVEFFWVVTSYSVAVEYQRFGGPCCLRLQGIRPRHYMASQPRAKNKFIYTSVRLSVNKNGKSIYKFCVSGSKMCPFWFCIPHLSGSLFVTDACVLLTDLISDRDYSNQRWI
jgi:hypothetical protein